MTELSENILADEDTQHGKFLLFMLDEETFGIDILHVTEIVSIQPITRIPEVSSYIAGIINLREKIIPVINMRIKFLKKPADYNDRNCIVIVEIRKILAGLIVDNVTEVISIPDESISPPPKFIFGIQNRYIKGIGKVGAELKLLLDSEKILADNDITDLVKAR